MRRFLVSCFCAFLVGPLGALAQTWTNVVTQGLGQDAEVYITGLANNENVSLNLNRPDQTEITFNESANQNGILETFIYGLHLQQSGTYQLNIERTAGDLIQKSFTLQPGVASAYTSQFTTALRSAPADGETEVKLYVQLKDAYGNPVPNKDVRLLSSRTNDTFEFVPQTDTNGVIETTITSNEPGTSIITAITEDTVIATRPEIVWYVADPRVTSRPDQGAPDNATLGTFLQAQLFGPDDLESPEVAYFRLEGLEPTVPSGETQNITVSARDARGDVVPNYRGTVRFTSSDDNALLPADYTFTETDQGQHTFFLALTFTTPGTHTLAVSDLNDFRIFGQWEGDVTSSTTIDPIVEPPANNGAEITLLTPKDGTYKSNRMTITGTATGCGLLRLKDNQDTLAEGIVVGSDGSFIYQTPRLPDGLHSFQAICESDPTVVSNIAQVRIDRTPPAAMSVEVRPPSPLKPGQPFEILLGSSEPLSAANCTFREIPNEHIPSGDQFVGAYTAPLEEGDYPVSCRVFDNSSNELSEPEAAIILVRADAEEPEPTTPDTPEIEEITFDPNGDADQDGVSNQSEWKDDNQNGIPDTNENRTDEPRDTDQDGLTDDAERNIYGTDPLNPDTDFGGITDGIEVLFLQTNPLDASSPTDESLIANIDPTPLQKMILALPSPLPTDLANDTDLDGVPDWLEAGPDKLDPTNDTDQDGRPNNTDAFPLRPNVGAEETKDDPSPVTNLTTECYPGDDTRLWLRWSPARSEVGVVRYRVNYGTDVRALFGENLTPDARTKWYVEGLNPGQTYSFAVRAQNQNGTEGDVQYVEGTTGCAPIVPPQPTLPPEVPASGSSTSRNLFPWFFGLLTGLGIFLMLRPQQRPYTYGTHTNPFE